MAMLQLQPGPTVGYGPKHKNRYEGNTLKADGREVILVSLLYS